MNEGQDEYFNLSIASQTHNTMTIRMDLKVRLKELQVEE